MRDESSSFLEDRFEEFLVRGWVSTIDPRTKYSYRISSVCETNLVCEGINSDRSTADDTDSCVYDIGKYPREDTIGIARMLA